MTSAIVTDSAGLDAGRVTIPVAGFPMSAYYARPAGVSRPPVVLVACEIFGVHEHIADVCRRLAKEGYLAVAPELFQRQGDPAAYSDMHQLVRELVAKVPDVQVQGDLDAAAAWALAQGGDPGRMGMTGFCWGGRQTWLYAAHNPALKAAVAWYGRLQGDTDDLHPRHPAQMVEELRVPVLGLYGAQDTSIPVATVGAMEAALRAAANPVARASQFVIFPDAGHAFYADYRPMYRPDAARAGWHLCLDWLRRHGVSA